MNAKKCLNPFGTGNSFESIIVLPCGVEIRDSTRLGLGLAVQANGFKRWVNLGNAGNCNFYVSTTGTWLYPDEVDEYIAELQLIKQACIEANEYFKEV